MKFAVADAAAAPSAKKRGEYVRGVIFVLDKTIEIVLNYRAASIKKNLGKARPCLFRESGSLESSCTGLQEVKTMYIRISSLFPEYSRIILFYSNLYN